MLLGRALSPCLGHSESSSFSSTQPAQLTPVLLGKRSAPQRQPNEPLRPALWHGVPFPVPMQSQPQPGVSSCRAVWGWWVSPVRCRTPQLQRSSARLSSRQPPATQRTELLSPPRSAGAVTGLEIQVPSLGVSRGAEEGLAAAGGGAAAGVSLPSDPPRRARPGLGEQCGDAAPWARAGVTDPDGADGFALGSAQYGVGRTAVEMGWGSRGKPIGGAEGSSMGAACRDPSNPNTWARMGLCGERFSGNAPC